MPVILSWAMKALGLKLTQAIAKASIDVLVKHTKTQYDDEVWEKVKKTMDW